MTDPPLVTDTTSLSLHTTILISIENSANKKRRKCLRRTSASAQLRDQRNAAGHLTLGDWAMLLGARPVGPAAVDGRRLRHARGQLAPRLALALVAPLQKNFNHKHIIVLTNVSVFL